MDKVIVCPKCGFKFSITYARAFACRGCQYAVFGDCRYIKCPKCGYEIPLFTSTS